MDINWSSVGTIFITVLPILSVVLIIVRKFFPGIDPYFKKGSVLLAEVDDIIDGILLEFPNNKYLNSIDDIVDKILKELTEAGYKVDQDDQKKIAYHVKGKLKKDDGTSVKWEDGKLKLQFNKKF